MSARSENRSDVGTSFSSDDPSSGRLAVDVEGRASTVDVLEQDGGSTKTAPQRAVAFRRATEAAGWALGYEPAVLAVVTPLLLFPSQVTPAALVVLVLIAAMRLVAGRAYRDRVAIGALAIVILFALQAAARWPDGYAGSQQLYGLLLGIAWFEALANADARGRLVGLVTAALLGAASLLALAGLLVTAWPKSKFLPIAVVTGQLPSAGAAVPGLGAGLPGFHPNVLAGVLAMVLPLGVALVTNHSHRIGRRTRMALMASIVLMGLVLILTQSRTAWLAALAAVGVVAATRLIGRGRVAAALLGALLVTSASLFLAVAESDEFVADVAGGGTESSAGFRLELARQALVMLADAPLLGTGLGGFPALLETSYQSRLSGHIAATHAHNFYLQLALDLGLPGALAFAGLVAVALRTAWASKPSRRWQRAVRLGLSGGVIAFLALGLTDAMPLGSRASLPIWVLLGLLVLVGRGVDPTAPGDGRVRRMRATERVRLIRGGAVLLVACTATTVLALARHETDDEWSRVRRLLVRDVGPADLVLTSSPRASAQLRARLAGDPIARQVTVAPLDASDFQRRLTGRHYVWLIATDGVTAPRLDMPRRELSRRARLDHSADIGWLRVARFELAG